MKTLICLLLFCFTLPFSPTDAYYFSSDSASLLSFKNSVSRDPSNLLASWNSTTDHCTWFGVTCDRFTGRVTGLALVGAVTSSSNVIAGTLPASISELAELRTLSIPHNVFSGQIPASIGELRFLEVVELQGNNFSGEIPYEISKLEALRVLNLSFNSLSGEVPRRVIGGGNLSVIELSNNQLAGGVVIDSVSKCEFLEHLKLSNNFLTENIPKEIGKCRNLRTLMLDGNVLEGPIPAEIGRISELRVLDVSRNSLTDRIPIELANCRKLSVVALTNLNEVNDNNGSLKGEFNAFDGGVPYELLMSSSLQILWAPRGNLGGRLPDNWNDSCSLRVLNLGQNGFNGVLPKSLGNCKNLTYLDLSLNNLVGYLPMQLRVPCMMYFNVSQNNITGVLTRHEDANCGSSSLISFGDDFSFLDLEDVQIAYANIPFWVSTSNKSFVIIHDFSSNRFSGTLPLFALGDEFMASKSKPVYRLLLNNNMFNESLPGELVSNCSDLLSLSVNLSANQLSGMIDKGLFLNCLTLMEFEAANNQIGGPIASGVDKLMKLQRLDLSGNRVSGSLPYQLGKLKFLKWIFLGGNNITGEIPSEFGKLSSLTVLDLSHNVLTGSIPASLSNATALETLLLDHNQLSGEIPSSFSTLLSLAILDISFNNLSGRIPHLHHQIDCNSFNENKYLGPCPDTNSTGPEKNPVQLSHDRLQSRKRLKSFIIAVVTSASAVLCIASVIVFVIFRRRRFRRLASLRGKVVVTFAETPTELTYDNVVRATGNFSIGNLIGTGGFGSTYKAELVPGYLVAVKKLYLGRFQGIQQFDAEIRTLGRIRHKNLEGRSSELFSPALWEAGPKENLLGMLRLATGCTVETLSVRPSVKQVLEKLKQLK
ncbi:hypothetical protein Patl1_02529 [Pistacia atlantica]|uniref:Uncharacterized protein n=1 Tax=Pistacia atlantica TaxID=434234 RepID=A0ACC1CC55_9ROSI|nr:hypothetical protein Patl1_02529 [Pistacia atlantica]